MSCPICSGHMSKSFSSIVLGKYEAEYEVCNNCGYLKATDPYWLHEAYTHAIAKADTGLVMRNIFLANKISLTIFLLAKDKGKGRYLDIAGGYGLLTRIMRDFGFDFYWLDKHCQNIIAPGFEYDKNLGLCSVVTAVEVLEHVTDPKAFIKEAFDISGATMLIFTTQLYEGEPPNPNDWWYYSFATGQHIGFFQRRTLRRIASDLDLHFATAHGLHLFSVEPINKFIFSLFTNRYCSIFLSFIIRKFLGSKTLIDHENMMKKIVGIK